MIQDGGADAVKLEGGSEVVPVVEGLIRAGVPVMGHVGLTPQTAGFLGGNKVQGKDLESARRILAGALALEQAGVFAVVLELIPAGLAELITSRNWLWSSNRRPGLGFSRSLGAQSRLQSQILEALSRWFFPSSSCYCKLC